MKIEHSRTPRFIKHKFQKLAWYLMPPIDREVATGLMMTIKRQPLPNHPHIYTPVNIGPSGLIGCSFCGGPYHPPVRENKARR